MATAAALTYRAIVRMCKDVAGAWTRQHRSTGPVLSGLATLSGDRLRQFDEQLGCRGAKRAASQRLLLKNAPPVEPIKAACVVPFAPVPSRRSAHDKKSASVLP